MAEIVDRAAIESFLEECNNTNFEVIARGVTLSGAAQGVLKKSTRYLWDNTSRTEVVRQTTGLRDGITVDGATRVFKQAANLADGDDWYRAIQSLVECGYYQQIELRPLGFISLQGVWGEQKNPCADLEPLIWRCEDGKVTTHGGARTGAGRPSLGGKLVPVDMPLDMIDALQSEARSRGISRAELVRAFIKKGLEQ